MPEGPSGASPDSDADHDVGLVVVSHSRALARAAVALADEMLHGRPVRIEVAAGPGRAHVRHRRRQHHGGDRARRRAGRRRRADGSRQCAAQRRAGARPAPGPGGPRPGDAVAGADRRGPDRRRGGGRRRSEPGRGRGRGARRAAWARPRTCRHRAERRRTLVPAEAAVQEVVGVFTVENPHGLHARPAARLVSEVRALDATVQLRNLTTGAGPVPAGSLSRVATLAALQGHEVEVRASGPQAQEAVEHLAHAGQAPVRRDRRRAVARARPLPAPDHGASRRRPAACVAGNRHRAGRAG